MPNTGEVDASNSVLGTVAGGGSMTSVHDVARGHLIVGRPASSIVSILVTDTIFTNGFE